MNIRERAVALLRKMPSHAPEGSAAYDRVLAMVIEELATPSDFEEVIEALANEYYLDRERVTNEDGKPAMLVRRLGRDVRRAEARATEAELAKLQVAHDAREYVLATRGEPRKTDEMAGVIGDRILALNQ